MPDLIDVTLLMTEYNPPVVDDDALDSTVPRNRRRREPAAPPTRTVGAGLTLSQPASRLIPYPLIS
ncbi:MAG: hypothetical protein ACRDQI_03190 [Pseudonocardiaceae bacterium]